MHIRNVFIKDLLHMWCCADARGKHSKVNIAITSVSEARHLEAEFSNCVPRHPTVTAQRHERIV